MSAELNFSQPSQVAVTEWGYFSEKWKHYFETNKHITPLTSQIIHSKSVVFDSNATFRFGLQNLWFLTQTPHFFLVKICGVWMKTLQFWILIWTERGVNHKRLNTLLLKGRTWLSNIMENSLGCTSWDFNFLCRSVFALQSFQYFVCYWLNFCWKILACNVGEVGLSCPLSGCEIYQQL